MAVIQAHTFARQFSSFGGEEEIGADGIGSDFALEHFLQQWQAQPDRFVSGGVQWSQKILERLSAFGQPDAVVFDEHRAKHLMTERLPGPFQQFRLVRLHVDFDQIYVANLLRGDKSVQRDAFHAVRAHGDIAKADQTSPSGMGAVALVKRDLAHGIGNRHIVAMEVVLKTVQPTIVQQAGKDITIRLEGVDHAAAAGFLRHAQSECSDIGAHVHADAAARNQRQRFLHVGLFVAIEIYFPLHVVPKIEPVEDAVAFSGHLTRHGFGADALDDASLALEIEAPNQFGNRWRFLAGAGTDDKERIE